MNLVIALMVTRQFLPKSRIRSVVQGYQEQSEDAFERMFERDKQDLRELGIRLEAGSYDPFFGNEEGYRIIRDDVELPDFELTMQETALLSVAAHVWDHMGLARDSTSAVAKLKAAGVDAEDDVVTFTEPTIAAHDPAFDPMCRAVMRRRPVSFEYRSPRTPAALRRLRPWAVFSWHGYWYVMGHDRDRNGTRVFRLNRITGPVENDGAADSYQIPQGLDVQAVAEQSFSHEPARSARVVVRAGKGVKLRRVAHQCETVDGATERLEVPYWDADDIAADIAAHAADAYVEGPDDVRERVIAKLRAGADADDIA